MSRLVVKKNLPKKDYPTFESVKEYWSKHVWNSGSEVSRHSFVGRNNGIGVLEEYSSRTFSSEETARKAIMERAKEKGVVCQFYGSNDILENNPEDEKCKVFIAKIKDIQNKIKTLVENECTRLLKQKYLVCPECGSKISSVHKVPKFFYIVILAAISQ